MPDLTPEKALIFRITHIENVPWLLLNGVCCRSSSMVDPSFIDIGNPDLIQKRQHREVTIPPGGSLSDYVPFYFTPYSPMLYNILTGYNGIPRRARFDIVILVSSLHHIASLRIPFVFSDRHAYLVTAEFFADPNDLSRVDWKILRNRDFKRDLNDLGKMERYQAEALIYRKVPLGALLGIVCADSSAEARLKQMVSEALVDVKIAVRPGWYL